MPQDQFYRYVSHPGEIANYQHWRVIHSTNPIGEGKTWFTNRRYPNTTEAQMYLALPRTPRFELGPIAEDEMPYFNVCCARTVEPAYGQPGGGVEFCTDEPIYLFNVLAFGGSEGEDT